MEIPETIYPWFMGGIVFVAEMLFIIALVAGKRNDPKDE